MGKLRSVWQWLSGRPESERPGPASGTGATTAGCDEPVADRDGYETFVHELAANQPSDIAPAEAATNGFPPEASMVFDDDGGPHAVFVDVVSAYAKPIKDFIAELEAGTATGEWIQICLPVMGSVIQGAQSLEMHDVAQRMVEFRDALVNAEATDGRCFDPEVREQILQRWKALTGVMPAAFAANIDSRRDGIILHSLLRQIPQLGRVTFDRLYGAGLTSLDALYVAEAEDLALTTEIPLRVCEQIVRKVREHGRQLRLRESGDADLDRRMQLARTVCELRRQHDRFRRISDDGSTTPATSSEKRDCLRRRQESVLQIDVLLAEMGDVALVDELRKLAVARRIERLEHFLGPRLMRAAGSAAPVIQGAERSR